MSSIYHTTKSVRSFDVQIVKETRKMVAASTLRSQQYTEFQVKELQDQINQLRKELTDDDQSSHKWVLVLEVAAIVLGVFVTLVTLHCSLYVSLTTSTVPAVGKTVLEFFKG